MGTNGPERAEGENAAEASSAAGGSRRLRLSPSEREQMILDAALNYFAENGFSARVRELAASIGVSQALIFRYFGSKDALIERVYEKTFLSRWNPEWETILQDRSRPLRERLTEFYRSYLRAVDERRWIRIAMLASLASRNLTRRYIQGPVARIITIIGAELRPATDEDRVFDAQLAEELVWHLHSTAIYYLIRKHIHGSDVYRDTDRMVDAIVDNFLVGLNVDSLSAAQAKSEPVSPRSSST